jgi:hypothetical protein
MLSGRHRCAGSAKRWVYIKWFPLVMLPMAMAVQRKGVKISGVDKFLNFFWILLFRTSFLIQVVVAQMVVRALGAYW